MPSPPVSSTPRVTPAELDNITLQIQDLRERVLHLEMRLGITAGPAATPVSSSPVTADFDVPSNTVPVLGRMVVAIAGGYVLRALTDWGVLPAAAGVAAGLVYALIWMFVAARSPAGSNFNAALNCCTSVLIMAPLVWE